MKKLLFLGPPFDFHKGGAEFQYKILEQEINNRFEIFYIFRHPTPINNKKYITYDYRLRKNYNENIYTDANKILRAIKRLSPDVIYKKGINYITAVGAYYAKTRKIGMVSHIASQRDVVKPKLKFGKKIIFDILNQKIARYTFNNSSKIICQAAYQNKLLQMNFHKSCDVIIPNFHPAPKQSIKKSDPIKVIWIANLKRLKQPELFIELARRLLNHNNAEFIMIGRQESSRWQKNIFDRIHAVPNLKYLGELPIEEVNDLLIEAHILVNTSQYEGFSNTYIQAWMRKVPVVALNSDPDDIIKKSKIGYHSITFDKMVQDVTTLIEHPELRDKMGKQAQTIAFKKFSTGNIDRFVNLIDQI